MTFNMAVACAGGQDEAYAWSAVRDDCECERNALRDAMYSFSDLRHADKSRVSVPKRWTMTKRTSPGVADKVDSKMRGSQRRAVNGEPASADYLTFCQHTS